MRPGTTDGGLSGELLSYLEVPLRRPLHVLIPFLITGAGALMLALNLPRQYRTSTLILVESQKVPDSFVRSSDDAARPSLQTIRQEILSRTRLERVIEELTPYPERVGKTPLTDVIEMMRGSVSINVKGEDAFSLEYVHRDPKVAQAVANRLAGLFIEETMRAREEQVTGAVSFIENQLEDARRQLEQKEKDLRRYKEAHMGSLPEQMVANLSTLQRLQLEQQSVASNLQSARQRLMIVEGSEGGLSAGGAARPGSDSGGELASLRDQLTVLRMRYTEEHPDVASLQARIAGIEARQRAAATPEPGAVPDRAPIRPRGAPLEVKELEERLADVERRIALFQQRVEAAPRLEQELTTLTRDYQKLNENYLQLLNKKLDAQMAERLEKRWKTEQFRVLDPAYLPEEPSSPRRTLIVMIGLVVGLVIGLVVAYAADLTDSSVKGLGDLEPLSPVPVLGLLPALKGNHPLPIAPGLFSGLKWVFRRTAPAVPTRATTGKEAIGDVAAPGSHGPPVFEEMEPVSQIPRKGVLRAAMTPGVTAEEFRSIASRIRKLDGAKPLRCLGVVSAVSGEGKSTVAAGIAASLAQKVGRVLLVEADLRRPALGEYLGLPPATGVTEWLRGECGEQVSVQHVGPAGLFFLSAGQMLERYQDSAFVEPEELSRAQLLLESARKAFAFVVVDCPPLLPVADAVVLQDLLDGFVAVVRERYAPIESIQLALDRLGTDRVRGVILNDHLEVLSRYSRYHTAYYAPRR